MVRSLIRAAMLFATVSLSASTAKAEPPSPAETEGNKMEKKGNVEEKAANAEKAKGAKMQKKGKAIEKEGAKSDNPEQEAAGKKMQKKGKAIEKEGEARGEAAAEMEKSGNKAEVAGVKARKDTAKANADAEK